VTTTKPRPLSPRVAETSISFPPPPEDQIHLSTACALREPISLFTAKRMPLAVT
jgi:hypothetical protein